MSGESCEAVTVQRAPLGEDTQWEAARLASSPEESSREHPRRGISRKVPLGERAHGKRIKRVAITVAALTITYVSAHLNPEVSLGKRLAAEERTCR